MVFEQRQVAMETLGEYLTGVRRDLQLEQIAVARRCGIPVKFLDALEAGRYEKLPPDVYVYGFLRTLANVYAVDSHALVTQYKKERGVLLQVSRTPSWVSLSGTYFARVTLTPARLSLFAGLLVIVLTLGYLLWQVISINSTPSLQIFEPKPGDIVRSSVVSVHGKTEPGNSVSINGQTVFVDGNGEFRTTIGLGNGQQMLTFAAKNKFDKIITKTVSLVADVPELPNQSISPAASSSPSGAASTTP